MTILYQEVPKQTPAVVPPTLRAVMLLCLVPCNSVLLSMIGTATTFMSVFELKAQ